MMESAAPVKGISLFFFTIVCSFVVLIYFFAWDSQNKIDEYSDYKTSWFQESSIFICPLH
tara:strand:+ start:18550 stop:18729 length:180 start_codon:yes stop_codon:yes gene_type:complete